MKFGIQILAKCTVRFEGLVLTVGISLWSTKEVKDFNIPLDFSSVIADPGCLYRIHHLQQKKGGEKLYYLFVVTNITKLKIFLNRKRKNF